ncbi:glucose-1-phosphate adenylyltransferase [Parendozoicomonas haliclonae]|nr:glucose-1-phosphate adenylyltransferase [Parendozoicomonas haliclonae]
MASVLSMILAGGEGTRLSPLTGKRAKPAVPFGGQYRIIDFVLSNFVNSDLHKIYLLTQFKSHSLNKHLQRCWRIAGLADKFIDTLPAQMNTGNHWYRGTADAIYQNLNQIESDNPDLVCIFGGDHIYTMNVRDMLNYHEQHNADLTVAAIPVPKEQAHHFGIIEIDEHHRMTGFVEKPKGEVKTIPGRPDYVLASMGNYIFARECLIRELEDDHANEESDHDFGKNIIPNLFPRAKVIVYDFSDNTVPGVSNSNYWRDVGTLESYWEANMDLLSDEPTVALNNLEWPINTYIPPFPPAKLSYKKGARNGQINNSMIGIGCEIQDCVIDHSILGYNIQVGKDSQIVDSIILPNSKIGAGVVLNRVIVDKRAEIAPGTKIGVNPEEDRKLYHVSDTGLIVIPRGARVGF